MRSLKNLAEFVYRRSTAVLLAVFVITASGLSPTALGQGEQAAPGQGKAGVARAVVPEREYYNEIYIALDQGVDAKTFAAQNGLTINRQMVGAGNRWIFNTKTVAQATQKATALRKIDGVESAFQNHSVAYQKHSFVPDDPFFNNPSAPNNFGGQWHLGNNTNLPNANLQGAWSRGITGQGVLLGIVDAGVEPGHEDIVENFSAANTFDFVRNTTLQNMTAGDRHGTSVAGVAAARGGNGIGITGAAPLATVGSMKVFEGDSTATGAGFANATLFNATGPNASFDVKNHSYGISANYVSDFANTDAMSVTAANGVINVVSAGNDRGTFSEDSNKKMAQANPDVITVAALGSDGNFASYSSFGANVFVTASSSSASGFGITTLDRTGNNGYNADGGGDYTNSDYTAGFGGTSSSAPLVAGVMTLGKQINPNMDVRLAKHLLARTSVIVDADDTTLTSDGGWRTNAAGFTFNQNYGFGNIDATAFVDLAEFASVSEQGLIQSGTIDVNLAIPDNNTNGLEETFNVTTSGLLEEVLVTLDIDHFFRGDLEAYLTSPSGYTSRLMLQSGSDSGNNIDWTFVSNAFWGEDALGTWALEVNDNAARNIANTGTWNSYSIEWRTGSFITAVPEPSSTAILGAILVGSMISRRRRTYA